MTLNSINEDAQRKFQELRSKLKLDLQKPHLQNGIVLTQEKIDQLLEPDEAREIMKYYAEKAADAANIVDDTFAFIDSLKLPPELSLAIGYIISANKTNNKQDIANAVAALANYTRL